MGRAKFRQIHYGEYGKCLLCDYEVKNKRALRLHFQYSHPDEEWENKEKNRTRCNICKKEVCKMH